MTTRRGPRDTDQGLSRVPRFRTVEEEAAFWDAHDSSEFEDQFVDADNVVFVRGGSTKAITVRLDEAAFQALHEQARQCGVPAGTLARLWILDHLKKADRAS